ncbi:MAG: methylated-DNA--[protein]-cysteine S-methyltransferase [Mediterranea sp.]|jgi:AraC family transcriptional regulator of adaptative response/methylated-DNA-[protein]-cysteine methyltransferase|nr:methylated-DNA--[protein]-cysteine S-methyltransferase [Mediterranea sp.]
MNTLQTTNFDRIRCAIEYIDGLSKQPTLDEVAAHVNLSLPDFRQLFVEWAGVSHEQFMQYISTGYARHILRESETVLYNTARPANSPSIKIESMTPDECKNSSKNLAINYCFTDSPFGTALLASTPKGLCYIAFVDDETHVLNILKSIFPKARYTNTTDRIQQDVLSLFTKDRPAPEEIKLHVKGTTFQLSVWEALLKIPMGSLTTYGNIAQYIGNPKASRPVGTAIGQNPVSLLVPCHRVIQSTGILGGYMWGPSRKKVMIGWEIAHQSL